jgi:hypothetical protein
MSGISNKMENQKYTLSEVFFNPIEKSQKEAKSTPPPQHINAQHRVHKKKTNMTLENTERAIKCEHYRETGNIGYTRKRQT